MTNKIKIMRIKKSRELKTSVLQGMCIWIINNQFFTIFGSMRACSECWVCFFVPLTKCSCDVM